MMLDGLCSEAALRMFPNLGHVLILYSAVTMSLRAASEACFIAAHICGKVDSELAKWLGKVAWWGGRVFGATGFGTSRLYLAKRYTMKVRQNGVPTCVNTKYRD